MTLDDRSLARCVGDVDAFRSTYWGRRPLHRRSGGGFTDLLDIDDVERVLALLARRPSFRVVRDGATLSVDTYTSPVRIGGTEVHDVADLDQIVELVAGGATVVLQGLQRTWLPLAQFCDDLQASVSHPVQANAYLSPSRAAALRRHVDHHAVFALQVAGTKAWNVDGLGDIVMEPGDVLYLPAETHHEARSQEEHSLHVTIGVLTVRWRDVLRRLQARAGHDVLDAPLPLGFARPPAATEVADGLQTAIDAVLEQLGKVDLDAVVEHEALRAERRRRVLPGHRLRVAVDPDVIGDVTRLRRQMVARLSSEGDHVVLGFGSRTLSLPAFTTAALNAVIDREELTVSELEGLDQPSRAVLARRLVREGLLGVIR